MLEFYVNARTFIGKPVKITIDRPLGSKHPKHGFVYEVNYGFVKGVMAGDGEELDAYVLGVNRPLKFFEGICIAVIHRTNDDDDKLVLVQDGITLADDEILKAVHFQEQWFESEVIRD